MSLRTSALPSRYSGSMLGQRYYADVHKTRKHGEGCRITYSTDGITFKHVDGFAEIPAGPGDQVFADTIPLSHMDGVLELLRRGLRSVILGGLR